MQRPAAFLAIFVSFAAAAGPSVEVIPARVKPGDPVLVVVRGLKDLPTGTVGTHEASFYSRGDDAEALVALPIEQEPGLLEVRVTSGGTSLRAPLEVLPPEFRERQLTVAGKYVKPPASARAQIKADNEAFKKAWATPLRSRAFNDNFQKPRDAVITAYFGDHRTYNGKKLNTHYALDLDGATGEEIRSANDGRVILVRPCYYSGNTVLVDHGAGLITAYFHMSKFLVKPGQEVRRGDLLGLVGKTGRVTGPHLHFGAHLGSLWVNPQALLALPFPGATSPLETFPLSEAPDGGTPDGGARAPGGGADSPDPGPR